MTDVCFSRHVIDNRVREESQQRLEASAAADLGAYLCGLVQELQNDAQIPDIRQAAGVIAKNALTAKDATTRHHVQTRWRSLADDIKQRIRDAVKAFPSQLF